MCVRTYEGHVPTDTDSTSDESDIGGMGRYSHGPIGLVHQHWIRQVISAGSFAVHCTEMAEAYHKTCMHRASIRVKHGTKNQTQDSMLRYLLADLRFESLQHTFFPPRSHAKQKTPFSCDTIQDVFQTWDHDISFRTPAFQETILHASVRVTRVEVLDLVCDRFQLPKNLDSYTQLQSLHWMFGHHLICKDGSAYWSKDARRDKLRLRGSEYVRGERNVLCTDTCCFFCISGLYSAGLQRFDPAGDDQLVFVLGRWFTPHSSSVERDNQHRPVCPGPCHINHTLWTCTRSGRPRRALVHANGNPTNSFLNHRAFFGSTEADQQQRLRQELHAWFHIVEPHNILCRINICPEFVSDSDKWDLSSWLESVVVIQ